jgi:formylmethanofuran dehydrogenase subunit B
MDDVPIRLRPALPSRYPSDEEVLRAIARRIQELREAPVAATAGAAR